MNGITLHAAEAGQGPLMLFCHGFPEFWQTWRRQLDEFGKDHFVVAPDMRGYNESDKPAGLDAYRIRELFADIAGIADYYEAERFTLVAHDWGGAAAWAFAIAHPERLERLIIVNAPHPALFARELANNPAQVEASQYMRLFREPDAEETLSRDDFDWLWRFSLGPLADRGLLDKRTRAAYREAWRRPGALTAALNWYRASPLRPAAPGEAGKDGPPALDPAQFQVKVPTLVVWGEQDHALLPGLLDGLEGFVPDLTVARLPTTGHWVTHEAPEELNRLIRDFIGRVGR